LRVAEVDEDRFEDDAVLVERDQRLVAVR